MLQDHRKHDKVFVLMIKFLDEEENNSRLKSVVNVRSIHANPFNKRNFHFLFEMNNLWMKFHLSGQSLHKTNIVSFRIIEFVL